MKEYLTIEEVAEQLSVEPKTISNKMAAGIFRKNVHFVRRRGIGTRFKWSAIIALLEGKSLIDNIDNALSVPQAKRGRPRSSRRAHLLGLTPAKTEL